MMGAYSPGGAACHKGACNTGRPMVVLILFLLGVIGSPFYRANPVSSGEGPPFPRPLLQLGAVLHLLFFAKLLCSIKT